MKRIVLFVLVFISVKCFSQFPLTQNIGSGSTLVQVPPNGGFRASLVNRSFTDTGAANLTPIRAYPGAMIFTTVTPANTLHIRNTTATKWLSTTGSGSITSFMFLDSSHIVICFSSGVCDTIDMGDSFIDVVNNIVQNFVDTSSSTTSITNIYNNSVVEIILSDSCVIRVMGNGNRDTTCFNFVVCSAGMLDDSTMFACPCPRTDTVNAQLVCDTTNVTPIPLYLFQNALVQIKKGIVESGGNYIHPTQYRNWGSFIDFHNYMPYSNGFGFTNELQSQDGSPLVGFKGRGYRYQHGLVTTGFYINQATSRIHYMAGAYQYSGAYIPNPMGDSSINYLWTNQGSWGGSTGYYLDDPKIKTVGIGLATDTFTANKEGIIFVVAPPNSATGSGGNAFPIVGGTGLVPYFRVGIQTDGRLRLYNYVTGLNDGAVASGDYILVPNATTGVLERRSITFATSSVNIYNSDGQFTGTRTVDGNNKGFIIDSVAYFGMSTKVASNKYSTFDLQSPNAIIRTIGGGNTTVSEIGTYAGDPFSDGTTNGVQLRVDNSITTAALRVSERYLKLLSDSVFMTVKAGVSGTTDSALYREPTTGLVSMKKVSTSVPINTLLAATGANTIDNTNYKQEWQWNTLAGNTGLKLSSTSTAAASNIQKLFEIALSGTNATTNQTTYGVYSVNSHGGTTSRNIGIYGAASGGATENTGVLGLASGDNTTYGVKGQNAGTGYGVYGLATGTGTGVWAYNSDGVNGAAVHAVTDFSSATGYGLISEAAGAGSGTAIAAYLSATGATNNYAIIVPASSGSVGIGNSTPNSTLQLSGSFSLPYVAKTSTYPITSLDYTIDCTSGTFTTTLPTAVGITGRIYAIKNSGSGTITIACTGGQNIDGVTTKTLGVQYSGYTVISDGANWKIISTF